MKKLFVVALFFLSAYPVLGNPAARDTIKTAMEAVRYYRDQFNVALDKIDSMKSQLILAEKLLEGRRKLSWECSDPDGDTLTYKIYFGTDSTNMYLTSITQDTFCLSGFQQKAQTYYWQVIACDQDTFTTGKIWHYSTEPDTVNITLHFNEPMDSASIVHGRYYVTAGVDTMPIYSKGFIAPFDKMNIVSIALRVGLVQGHTYTIEAYDVKDLAGNLINPEKNKAVLVYPIK